MVQAVGGVALAGVGGATGYGRESGPLVGVVAPGVAGEFAGLVAGVAVGLVLRRAGEVVG